MFSAIGTLEWLFVARWGIAIWFNYVIIVERICTSESMNPRPCFQALQYRLLTFVTSYLAVFIFSDYKNLYLPSILHIYHHLFAELVHLYNLPLYWVCWGHKRLFVIWLQGCLRQTIFILRLPRIDKTLGHPLEGNLLLSYEPLQLEAQQRLQEEGCVVDIKLFSGAVAGRWVLEGISLDLAVESFCFLFYH